VLVHGRGQRPRNLKPLKSALSVRVSGSAAIRCWSEQAPVGKVG
jgi:hypothetical protein